MILILKEFLLNLRFNFFAQLAAKETEHGCCELEVENLFVGSLQVMKKFGRKPSYYCLSNLVHIFGILKRETILMFKSSG